MVTDVAVLDTMRRLPTGDGGFWSRLARGEGPGADGVVVTGTAVTGIGAGVAVGTTVRLGVRTVARVVVRLGRGAATGGVSSQTMPGTATAAVTATSAMTTTKNRPRPGSSAGTDMT